jgi:hypothetical protein
VTTPLRLIYFVPLALLGAVLMSFEPSDYKPKEKNNDQMH